MSSLLLPSMLPDGPLREGEVTDGLDVAINVLQQRELLEPVLLLSSGYLATPFLWGQLRLLLTPLLLLFGVSWQEKSGKPR
jgi:hypothetical protein